MNRTLGAEEEAEIILAGRQGKLTLAELFDAFGADPEIMQGYFNKRIMGDERRYGCPMEREGKVASWESREFKRAIKKAVAEGNDAERGLLTGRFLVDALNDLGIEENDGMLAIARSWAWHLIEWIGAVKKEKERQARAKKSKADGAP